MLQLRRVGLGIAQRRFNQAVNPGIRLLDNWKRFGSVTVEDFGGRSNVVCLHTKKRAARIRYTVDLKNDAPHAFTVDVFSPVENESWGVGLVNGEWHPSNGMWKTIEAVVVDGKDIVITSIGKDNAMSPGDKCYVDLASIRIN